MTVLYDKDGFEQFRRSTVDDLMGALDAARSRLGSLGRIPLPQAFPAEQAKADGILAGLPDIIVFLERMTDSFDHRLRVSAERYEASDARTADQVGEAGSGLS